MNCLAEAFCSKDDCNADPFNSECVAKTPTENCGTGCVVSDFVMFLSSDEIVELQGIFRVFGKTYSILFGGRSVLQLG